MTTPPSEPTERIPLSLGASEYAIVWDRIASVREHAFELVDESQTEAALAASGATTARALIQGLGLGADDIVLEIGCGVARVGKPIAQHVREWWGLDVSARMIEIARERTSHATNVRYFVGNGRDLAAVPAGSVDKMYCHGVFIHMDKEDVYSYLVDARRVLKPGGLFYFDVWNLCDEAGWLRWQVERNLYRSRAERPLHRNQFSSPDEVRQLLRKAGWDVLHWAETFYVQPVVTHVPPGTVDRAAFLAGVRDRTGACYETLRYGPSDYRGFVATLAARLRQAGIEPEIDEGRYA